MFELIERLQHNTLQVSLPGFQPELAICATIVLLLLGRMLPFTRWIDTLWIALGGTLVALYLARPWQHLAVGTDVAATPLFDGMLQLDTFTIYFRGVLLLFVALFLIFSRLSGIPDREDAVDIYALVLGSTLGMMLMASANHLFVVFMGIEMASVPSYALAGVLKGRRISSEAALKYAIFGAGTAGVMLYGISLLAGALGTLHLPTMVNQLADMPEAEFAMRQTVLLSGGLMLMVGLAFKLSAVPFHFWCPDVFEGAPAEVDAFLSVASKAAALALLVRVAIGFGHVPTSSVAAVDRPTSAVVRTVAFAAQPAVDAPVAAKAADDKAETPATVPVPLAKSRRFMVGLISLLAAVTATFGNLAAYSQTNLKRLLAYSTIAHAGYMMMPVAAALAVVGRDPELARESISAICFYIGTYLFMNLGAFAVVAFVRNETRSEEIRDYAGMIRRSPGLVVCFGIILVSLLGLPPMSGFAAKLLVFKSLVTDPQLYTLLIIGGLNTVLSLVYYLRVVKVMTIDAEPQDRVLPSFSMLTPGGVFITLMTIPVAGLGIWWDPLNVLAQQAVRQLFS
ncbi:MAG: NADH-quinone oxidoreductase subunit N [Planctomycetaceae bacterium]|nr:NADH-quinone oxidoreductase subunit N [Planctomycetaceae bacterium]